MRESKFQSEVRDFLKANGFGYWKCQQNATTPVGVSDIIFWYKTVHGFLECKRDGSASYRPGQKAFLRKQGQWCYAKAISPDNWEKVQQDLLQIKKDTDVIEKMINHGPSNEEINWRQQNAGTDSADN